MPFHYLHNDCSTNNSFLQSFIKAVLGECSRDQLSTILFRSVARQPEWTILVGSLWNVIFTFLDVPREWFVFVVYFLRPTVRRVCRSFNRYSRQPESNTHL